MSDPREVFVTWLADELATALGDPDTGGKLEVVDGPLDGPQSDRNVACVWWEGVRPFSRDGNVSTDFYRVRIFKRWVQEQGGDELRAGVNAHLRKIAADLEVALRARLVSRGHDYFVVNEVTPDYQRQCVDAQLVAYDRNRSAAGG